MAGDVDRRDTVNTNLPIGIYVSRRISSVEKITFYEAGWRKSLPAIDAQMIWHLMTHSGY
ncbi:hypothetical protein ACFLQU_04135 [Verrucomicrobiota bacterium]